MMITTGLKHCKAPRGAAGTRMVTRIALKGGARWRESRVEQVGRMVWNRHLGNPG